jgi:hypothetical protein
VTLSVGIRSRTETPTRLSVVSPVLTFVRADDLIGFFFRLTWIDPPFPALTKSPIGAKMGRYCGQMGRSLGSDAVPVDKVTALTITCLSQ